MPKERIIALFNEEIEGLKLQIENYDRAIDVRRETIKRTAVDLAGVKNAIKAFDRAGVSKRYINGIYAQMVEDHNQHLAVLARLKDLLKEAREKAFLKEDTIKRLG